MSESISVEQNIENGIIKAFYESEQYGWKSVPFSSFCLYSNRYLWSYHKYKALTNLFFVSN